MEKAIIDKNKEEFLNIVNTYIKRDGIDKFLNWLNGTDFFTAPASTQYHLAERGGLCQHTLNVYRRLNKFLKDELGENYQDTYSQETIAIVALFHDICKANCYVESTRNVKDHNGEWQQVPIYKFEEKLKYGHGTKSVFILQQFIKLSLDEALAIRYHMGGMEYNFCNFVEPGVSEAYTNSRLALFKIGRAHV